MDEYVVSLLKGIGGILFIQPVIGVFEYYLDTLKDKDKLRVTLQYHAPLIIKLIDKYKKEE